MTPRLAAGVALVLLVGVFVWWVGGDTSTERAVHGDEAAESTREVDGSAALAPVQELAAADRAVEARASLDDRRAWSATLAFAPDMAWLAPQLVWRVRAAGGDSDDVVEPLAPLPPDLDGDGAIELALRAPPQRVGERVVLDLHVREGRVARVATLDLPGAGARVPVGWSDVPLVAAGFIRDHGLVGERLRHEQVIASYDGSMLSESSESASWDDMPAQVLRGANGEFALFAAPLARGGRSGSTWHLWLQGLDGIDSSKVEVTVGQTGAVLEVDRGAMTISIDLDPSFEYPGVVLRVDDANGATIASYRIDELRGGASKANGRVVLKLEADAGAAVFALAAAEDARLPIVQAANTPVAFNIPRGKSTELPLGGPLVVVAHPDVAVLRLSSADSVRVRGTWVCSDSRRSAFDFMPRAAAPHGPMTARSLALLVPRDAERIEIEAPGYRRAVIDAWRRSERVVVLEPIEPARVTFDWSESSLRDIGGTVDVQFWTFRAEARTGSGEPTNSHDFVGMSSAASDVGSTDAVELAMRDDVEFANVIVRWSAPSEGGAATHEPDPEEVVQIRDITSGGETYFVWDAWGSVRALRLVSGREYTVQIGNPIPKAP